MSIAREILAEAQSHNIVLYLKGSQLAYISEQGEFPEVLKTRIRQHKDDIVAYLLNAELDKQKSYDETIIKPVAKDQPVPLSFSQQGLWFIDKLEGGSSQYNIHAPYMLTGAMDVDALQQALSHLVERHVVFRTVFEEREGVVCQVIKPFTSFSLPVVDLTLHNQEQQHAELLKMAAAEKNQSFNLQTDLMLRGSIVKLSEDQHALLITMHHIVSDGWSQVIMLREIASLYDNFCKKLPSNLPPLDIQFTDYAKWQRTYFNDDRIAQQLGFWRERLENAPATHSLPFDRERQPRQTFSGKSYIWESDKNLLAGLKNVAAQNDATLFMVLYTAFALFIGRWSNTRDIVIGSPIAGRTHPQVANVIGYFLNTIVYRTTWQDEQSFASLLRENRQHTLSAYDYQDIPFDTLVDALKVPRELSHSPIFQLMFTLQNNEESDLELGDLQVDSLAIENCTTKFDIQLEAAEQQNGLWFNCTYSTHLFEQQTIQAMTQSFTGVLQQIAEQPDILIGDVLLAADGGQDFSAKHAAPDTVGSAFERIVQQCADSLAMVSGATQITYRQLDSFANQVARYLLEQGLKSDQELIVGCENAIHQHLVMLAALKLGCRYQCCQVKNGQPIFEGNTGQNRQVSIVSDVETTDETLHLIKIPELNQFQRFSAEPLSATEADVVTENIAFASPNDGKNQVSHEQLLKQVDCQIEFQQLDVASGILVLPSTQFFAPSDWLAGLLSGATLVLSSRKQSLEDVLLPERVTHVSLTPALLGQLTLNKAYQLQRICVVNHDQSCQSLVWQWAEYYPVDTVLHLGPRTWLAAGSVTPHCDLNLGKLLDASQTLVLSHHKEITPTGAIGELFVRNQKLLSDKAKMSGLFESTGLKVKQRHDGNLVLLDNHDSQVSRCESLVEATLSSDEAVTQTIVSQNTAYVVLNQLVSSTRAALEDLRDKIKSRLPASIVPEHFMRLASLPVKPNGEVDRTLLAGQVCRWERALQAFPAQLSHNGKSRADKHMATTAFAIPEDLQGVISELAEVFGTDDLEVFASVFALVMGLNRDQQFMPVFISGLKDKNGETLHNPVLRACELAPESTIKTVVQNTLLNLAESKQYAYVDANWLVSRYNQLHFSELEGMSDYLLRFGGYSDSAPELDALNCSLVLQIEQQTGQQSASANRGVWHFNSAHYTEAVINKINGVFNQVLSRLKSHDSETCAMLKAHLNQATRDKVRSAKRKFRAVKK